MSTTDHRIGTHTLASTARSILACPAAIDLVVDGVDSLAEILADENLTMRDVDGVPTFSCPPGSELARVALTRPGAVLQLTSGLHSPADAHRLKLAGGLTVRRLPECGCCGEPREIVELAVDFALLVRGCRDAERVPLEAYLSPVHQLNAGYLRRSVDHANAHHQEELRHAAATLTRTRAADVVGVQLAGLTADGVELRWVDPTGARATYLRFPWRARTTSELADLLRQELHSGLC